MSHNDVTQWRHIMASLFNKKNTLIRPSTGNATGERRGVTIGLYQTRIRATRKPKKKFLYSNPIYRPNQTGR